MTFAVTGFGNGLMLVYERLIVQELVPDRLTARIFGVKDALTAWAFALSFLAAGGLVSVFGARAVVVSAGAAVLVVSTVVAVKLRRSDVYTTPRPSARGRRRGPAITWTGRRSRSRRLDCGWVGRGLPSRPSHSCGRRDPANRCADRCPIDHVPRCFGLERRTPMQQGCARVTGRARAPGLARTAAPSPRERRAVGMVPISARTSSVVPEDDWAAVADDPDQGGHDGRVELAAGVVLELAQGVARRAGPCGTRGRSSWRCRRRSRRRSGRRTGCSRRRARRGSRRRPSARGTSATIWPTRPSRPPTRSSRNWPSIVWVFMTSNSVGLAACWAC